MTLTWHFLRARHFAHWLIESFQQSPLVVTLLSPPDGFRTLETQKSQVLCSRWSQDFHPNLCISILQAPWGGRQIPQYLPHSRWSINISWRKAWIKIIIVWTWTYWIFIEKRKIWKNNLGWVVRGMAPKAEEWVSQGPSGVLVGWWDVLFVWASPSWCLLLLLVGSSFQRPYMDNNYINIISVP